MVNGQSQKRKKKNKGSNKIRPGSLEDLVETVGILKYSCVDTTYRDMIAGTIEFLTNYGNVQLARKLYEKYVALTELVQTSQTKRLETYRQLQTDHQSRVQREGTLLGDDAPIQLELEKEVNDLKCASLPTALTELFSLLPV